MPDTNNNKSALPHQQPKETIKCLQAGRFIAAIMVTIHHAALGSIFYTSEIPITAKSVMDLGYLGVDFFFVLSGFIIHYSTQQSKKSPTRYIYSRLTRILLPYWPVAITLALAYLILPGFSNSERQWGWIPTITLFPTELPPALSVAWTLQHELIFYCIYGLLFYKNFLKEGLFLWTLSILAANAFQLSSPTILATFASPLNLEFIAGILVAELVLRRYRINLIISACLMLTFVILFLLLGGHRSESWIIGMSIASVIPWLCQAERNSQFTIPTWAIIGGNASYSLYLVHNPLLSVISRAFARIDTHWTISLATSVVFCVVAGFIYFYTVERQLLSWSSMKNKSAPRNRIATDS